MNAKAGRRAHAAAQQHGCMPPLPRRVSRLTAATSLVGQHGDLSCSQINPRSAMGPHADLVSQEQGQEKHQVQHNRSYGDFNGPGNTHGAAAKHQQHDARHQRNWQLNAHITCKVKACRTWEEAFNVFIQYSDAFNSTNTSALIHHMSKLLAAHSASGRVMADAERQDLNVALQELHEFAEAELPRLGPRELANTAYGLSKMGILSRRFAQLMLGRADPAQLNNQELANVLWSLAHAGHQPADVRWLQAVMQQLGARAHRMKSQELANSMWALSRMRVRPGAAVLEVLLTESQQRAAYLQPADLSNIMQALAIWRYTPSNPRALAPLYVACADQACMMKPHISSTIMWAVAVADWQLPSAWLSYMCQALAPHLPGAVTPNLEMHAHEGEDQLSSTQTGGPDSRGVTHRGCSTGSGTVQDLGQVGVQQQGTCPCIQHEEALYLPSASVSLEQDVLMQRQDGSQWEAPLCDVSERSRHRVSTRDAAVALYALARRAYQPRQEAHSNPLPVMRLQVLQGLVDVVLDRAWSCPPQDLVMCIWAATKLGYHVPEGQLCTALAASTIRVDQYQPRQLAWLVGTVAKRGFKAVPPTWLKAVCRHMIMRSALWQPQDISHTLWGLARLGQRLSGKLLRVLLFTLLHPGEDEVPAALGRGVGRKLAALSTHTIQSPDSSAHQSDQEGSCVPSISPKLITDEGAEVACTARQKARTEQDGNVKIPAGLCHQHLANAMWAIPQLLPPDKRQQFEYLNHDLLKQVEQLSLQLLQQDESERASPVANDDGGSDMQPATASSSSSTGNMQDVSVISSWWQSSRASMTGLVGHHQQQHQWQPGRHQQQQQLQAQGQQHAQRGWARSELLQMVSGFAALGHRPSRVWVAAHCKQAMQHWEHLPQQHQMQLLRCYEAIGNARTIGKFKYELGQIARKARRQGVVRCLQALSMAAETTQALAGHDGVQRDVVVQSRAGGSKPSKVASSILPFNRTTGQAAGDKTRSAPVVSELKLG